MNREEFKKQFDNRKTHLSDTFRQEIVGISCKNVTPEIKGVVIMEELAELQKEVSKYIRGEGDWYALLEEMADAYICMRFLREAYLTEGFTEDDIEKAIDIKLLREYERRIEANARRKE